MEAKQRGEGHPGFFFRSMRADLENGREEVLAFHVEGGAREMVSWWSLCLKQQVLSVSS